MASTIARVSTTSPSADLVVVDVDGMQANYEGSTLRIALHSSSTFRLFLISYNIIQLLVAERMITDWLANASIICDEHFIL